MTYEEFVEEVAKDVEAFALAQVLALRGADLSDVRNVEGTPLARLRDARLPPEIVADIAQVIVRTAFIAALSPLQSLEGRADTIKLTDGSGRYLAASQGISTLWLELWLDKFGGVEKVAATQPKKDP
jgi:hypothetical protein